MADIGSMIFSAGNSMVGNPTQALFDGYKMKREKEIADQAAAAAARAESERLNSVAANRQYFAGDYAGARQTAINGDNFAFVNNLDEASRARVGRLSQANAKVASLVRGAPEEQRLAVFDSQHDNLVSAGWTPEKLAAYRADPNNFSNGILDAHISEGRTLEQMLTRQEKVEDRDAGYANDEAKSARTIQFDTAAGGGYIPDKTAPGGFRQVTAGGIRPQVITAPNADGGTDILPFAGTGGGLVGGSGANNGGAAGMTYGGGQLPASIRTVGDVVSNKRALVNSLGASPVGMYQINADTWADFGPKALGPNWKNADVRDPRVQDAVAEKIWESTGGNPSRIAGRWASLSDQQARDLAGKPWAQVRDVISGGETKSRASTILNGGGGGQSQASGGNANGVIHIGGGGGDAWQDTVRNGVAGQVATRGSNKGKFDPYPKDPNAAKPLDTKTLQGLVTKRSQGVQIIDTVNRMRQLEKSGNLRGGYFGGRVAGNLPLLSNPETAEYDALAARLRQQITSLTRVPGIGSQSDYDAKLANAATPERTQAHAARTTTYNQITRIAQDMIGDVDTLRGGQGGGRAQSRPAQQQPRKAPPQPGQVVNGYKFRGGDIKDRNNWVKQ